MDIVSLTSFFGWCSVINMGLLLFWSLFFMFAPDLVYRLQSKFFPISRETYNVVIYAFLGLFKVFVIVLNIVPWIALKIMA